MTNTKPKIALAMIIKDDSEAKEVHRALGSVAKWVDGIFLTVTNKGQKKIKEVAKEYGATLSHFKWIKDFSAARNYNFSQVPKEYDFILWMDADDMFQGGENLQSVAQMAMKNDIWAVFCRYLYSVELDEQGGIKNILIEHLRERLIRNNGAYKWIAPIHETLIDQTNQQKQTDTNEFLMVHLADHSDMEKSMYRNIEILEKEVVDNPSDPRPIYYLAKAYFDTRDPLLLKDKIGKGMGSLTSELLKNYLRTSGWTEERAQAWEYLAIVHRENDQYDSAIIALMEAQTEWPQYPSIYIQLAMTYVLKQDWAKALHWVKVATHLELPKTTLVLQPKDYQSMILECLFHIHFNTQNLEMTERTITDLVEMIPNDLNKSRYAEVKDWRDKNNLAHWIIKLANHLNNSGQKGRLKALINAIPGEIDSAPALVSLRNDLTPPRKWGSKEVAIYCGPGFEKWSPKSAAKGIGGSEEAVILLSQELNKLGWKVTVFADPEVEGDYDGVTYLPYYYVNWKDQFNVLISWRQIQLFDMDIKAKKSYLWNHDIQNPLTYTPERVNKIDKVFFLSKWHRENVPELDESKIMYTANGLTL